MLNRLLKIISVIVLVILAINFWPASFGGDTEFILVSGQSMHPTILDGSLVITKHSPPYNVDDIVAFYSQESRINIVHRIIEVTDNGSFITQGDNNVKPDPGSYTYEDIFGEVVFATPYVGQMMELFREPMFLVFSAIVLVAIQMFQKNKKEKKEKMRRILLGLPKPDPKLKNKQKKINSKPNHSIFLWAMIINIATFALLQVGISHQFTPEGDLVTGFLFKVFNPSFASILSFSLYFILIIVLFSIARKNYQKTKYQTWISQNSQKLGLSVKKKQNYIHALTQLLIALFILMSFFHLISFAPKILPLLNS